MAIRMVWDATIDDGFGRGGWVPRFACDQCGQLIDDARLGHALWNVPRDGPHEQIEPVFHVHTSCDDRFRARVEQGSFTYWAPLTLHTLHIANNVLPIGRGLTGVLLVRPTPAHPDYDET